MKSLLNMKRLPGILAVALVALAVGAAGAPATASTSDATATISALTKAQKKKRAKAMKKCKKIKKAAKRKKCIKRVKKRFRPKKPSNPVGKTHVVEVRDDYYSPAVLNVKVNDLIKWDWKFAAGREAHNVALSAGPAGVRPSDFSSQLKTGPDYTFTRPIKVAGSYTFICQIHTLMTMNVEATK
ncbi:MAG: hypothetical protein M3Y23_01890 [Actinomycetota bacterium]|nr:hypothetical protein [Actinomycetota bacterium]